MNRRRFIVLGSASVVAVGVLLTLYGMYVYPTQRDVSSAKDLVSGMMKDPGSVVFEDVRRHASKTKGAYPLSVCGQVNAKNGFGALAGFQRFIVDVKSGSVKMDPQNIENEDQATAKERECQSESIDGNPYGDKFCEEAVKDIRDKEIQQIDFEILWQENCAIPFKAGI